MALIVVGISKMNTSDSTDDVLVTYSLGSCIGLTMHDPITKVGGMLHYMLPLSRISPDKASTTPGMFADTGITMLLASLFKMGASKSRLIVKAAGGSNLLDQNAIFNIGERNYLILRKIMWKNNILLKAADVGGMVSRTMRFDMSSGEVTVKSGGSTSSL